MGDKMGIRHLEKIENLLRENTKDFTRVEIRDILKMDYNEVKSILNYLNLRNRVKMFKDGDVIRVRWNNG